MELCKVATDREIASFEATWFVQNSYLLPTDVKVNSYMDISAQVNTIDDFHHIIESMVLVTECTTTTPYKVKLMYENGVLNLTPGTMNLYQLKVVSNLHKFEIKPLVNTLTDLLGALELIEVIGVSFTFMSRENRINVSSLELATRGFDAAVNYENRVQELFSNVSFQTIWPVDFPDKLYITLNDRFLAISDVKSTSR